MPAFYNVFLSLLKDPKVDLIYVYLFSYDLGKEIDFPEEFKDKLVVKPIYIKGRMSLYINFIKTYFSGVKLVRNKGVDVIYSHGTISFIGSLIGLRTKVNHFRRIYGTFLYPKVLKKKNPLLANFFEYLSFKLPSNGLIVTNDGTSGDKVFNYINKKKSTKLHFLLNGIDKKLIFKEKFNKFPLKETFFTYIARVDEWKRQHLLIEVLGELKKEGVEFPHTYIVGPIYSKLYKDNLEIMIIELGLSSNVSIKGAVSKYEANYLLKKSLLSFSLYDYSNLGNVFLEGLSLGTPMVAINEYNSLDSFPKNVYLSLDKADKVEIKRKIQSAMENPTNIEVVKENAIEYSHKHILSWEDRISVEKNIIFN